MNKLNINIVAIALALAFSTGAIAEGMSKTEYKAAKEKISAEYKTLRTSCAALSGNAKDVCTVEAKGKERLAEAELKASYQPTQQNSYEARVIKAEADQDLAVEKCDDRAGNAKDVCVKEAKAAATAAKADAKAQMKTSDANMKAAEKTADARSDANKKSADARKDAAEDKSDANYTVAKEKCDTYSGSAKDACLGQAKTRFNK